MKNATSWERRAQALFIGFVCLFTVAITLLVKSFTGGFATDSGFAVYICTCIAIVACIRFGEGLAARTLESQAEVLAGKWSDELKAELENLEGPRAGLAFTVLVYFVIAGFMRAVLKDAVFKD